MLARTARALAGNAARASIRCGECASAPVAARQEMMAAIAGPSRYASTQGSHPDYSGQRVKAGQQPRKVPNLTTKPKPPKRRLEAVSQPLRNASSSSRGPILKCIAHTTAERYDLASLGGVLRNLGVSWNEAPEGDHDAAFVIGPWKGRGGAERLVSGKDARRTSHPALAAESSNTAEEQEEMDEDGRDMGFGYGERGEIWVFNNGSFVTWGLTEEEGRAFLRDVIRRKGAMVELDRLAVGEYEVEEVDFVVDYSAETEVLGNLILLGRPPELSTFSPSPSMGSLLARYTLSLSLSRSSALSVLEDRLDSHIASVSTLPRALERSGAQPMGRREVIRKMGELMSLRMAVNTRGGGLDDTPEIYWSEPELEKYFDSLAAEFEISERIDAINKKIDYAQEIQNTLRALLTEASAHRMELIIIALIAVEVVIVLIREGPELTHKLFYPIVTFVHDLIDGTEQKGASQAIADELPKLEHALEALPHTHLISGLTSTRDGVHPDAEATEQRRLV